MADELKDIIRPVLDAYKGVITQYMKLQPDQETLAGGPRPDYTVFKDQADVVLAEFCRSLVNRTFTCASVEELRTNVFTILPFFEQKFKNLRSAMDSQELLSALDIISQVRYLAVYGDPQS